jgi:hypothetical protein
MNLAGISMLRLRLAKKADQQAPMPFFLMV